MKTRQDIASGNPQLVGRCCGTSSFSVSIKVWFNYLFCMFQDLHSAGYIYMAMCYRVVNFNSKEFSLFYLELSESCIIAELANNLEPIVLKTQQSWSMISWK